MRAFSLLALLAVLTSAPALAGEDYLGVIVSGAGADTTNESTAAPFLVPRGAKLTLYCTATALICVDTTSACTALGGAKPGLPWDALKPFPTSTRSDLAAPTVTISSKASAIVRIVGPAAVTCYVWQRYGNE